MWTPSALAEGGAPPGELGLKAPKGEPSPGKLLPGCESKPFSPALSPNASLTATVKTGLCDAFLPLAMEKTSCASTRTGKPSGSCSLLNN